MTTILLPVPIPGITLEDDNLTIDRTATELAKQQRASGWTLTVDDNKVICCGCKRPVAHRSLDEPPDGFRWDGCFCSYCLGQGKLAKRFGLIIDQITCDIVPFDKNGI